VSNIAILLILNLPEILPAYLVDRLHLSVAVTYQSINQSINQSIS